MKRTQRLFNFLLLVLLIASSATFAEAKTHPRKSKKKAAAEAVEMTADGPAKRGPNIKPEKKGSDNDKAVGKPGPAPVGPPVERHLTKASGRRFDVRTLPRTRPVARDRVELEPPVYTPVEISTTAPVVAPDSMTRPIAVPTVQAPPPINVFEGLDRFNFGAGSPPDTNGDVGPNYYIQTVNTSVGIFRKNDGFMEAGFSFNTFMSQGNFGNLCDTNNFGDPVVLYDTFEDRWIITDFAFLTDISGNVLAPAYQCFAVSMNGNPLTGGWNYYSIQISDALNDYEKFGIWPDGLYMSANMFTFGAGSSFKGARAWAFNKAQMYAGSPTVKIVSFDIGGGDFTVIPSNARLQTGTPPAGRPNMYLSTWLFTNALTVYKFHVDWNSTSLSTFTGPDVPIAATAWPNAAVANAAQPGTATLLDVLQIRAMVQSRYTNFGGTESLWVPHTVRRGNTSGFAAPRWYQVDVTGGTVAGAIPQAATWDPDGANVINRFMPSLALDRAGNMALGYSTSNGTTGFPSMAYAGRLAADPVNTFSKTEQTFFTGTASQTGTTRWGDYSSVSLDPDGCTFWLTNEYANPADQTFNHRWLTKFGSFVYPECTPVGAGGTVSGQVTVNPGGAPIAGATVNLGARTATTDGSGNYAFLNIPAGVYPSIGASKPGFFPGSASPVTVTDGGTTTQNFSLSAAPPSACVTDTTQADFLTGVATNVDVNASPGDVTLSNAPVIDQQNTAGTTTGTGFGTPAWTGQTFIAAVTGQLVKADIQLFCSGCGATPPNLTLSVRATAAGLPTGADLASVTVPGSAFASGSTTLFTATFGSPVSLTSGTQYALILRPVSAPAGSGYFWIRSSPSTYANGSRVLSADSGGTWSADTTRDYNFKTYMQTGYAASGNLVSSPKDSNPSGGLTPIWATLSWNASAPANTSVQFQVAGSNNVNGPFNFVGPDGTAGTFFTTSPASLGVVYGFRYIEYKAYLATTNGAVTPTVNDVTACFNDVDCSTTIATITPTPASVCSNSTGNTASGPAGMTAYSWGIANGTITSATNIQTITYTAGASGSVTLTLTITAPNGCIASGSTPVTINPLPTTPSISGTLTFCTGGNTTLSSDSNSGNQWFLGGNPIAGETNQTLLVSAAGSYTVQVTDGNGCSSAFSSPAVVSELSPPPVPTIAGTTNGTGTQDQACPEQPLTLTATSSGATSFQWYSNNDTLNGETNATYQATGAATYYVTATVNGCTSAQSAGYVVQNPTPHSPFVSFRGQDSSVTTLAICQGSSQIIDSDSATGIQWWKDGAPIPGANSQSYTATQAGVYTAQLNALGCHSQFGRDVTLTVDTLPPTPSISGDTNGTGTQDQACPEQPLTLHANGATGATSYTWYSDNAVIPGETSSTLVMTGVGNISVTATNGTCTTAHSATYVVQNPTPHSPFVSFRGQASSTTSLSICQGQSQIIDSDSATGIQWWKDGAPIPGANSQSYTATQSGVYTAQLNALGCHSQFGRDVTLTVNPIPATPTATPGGPTTFCSGGSVLLTSSSASGNQWLLNGNPIGGATNQTYSATASGSYTVTVTVSGCTSPASAAVVVTVNPTPATPTISGNSSFCTGGNTTLTSSSASGNQWYLNGNPIGGATGNTYLATVAGDYTVVVTATGCSSAPSAVKTVTVNPLPDATITTPAGTFAGSTGNIASVANAGAGATYNWGITNGTITAGTGTSSITYTAGAVGTLTLNVTVTTAAGCADTKSANVNVTAAPPPVTVTSVVPANGPFFGGVPVTVNGTGFLAGATVTFGGASATNVVVVSAIKITCKTPAHAPGAVNVTVTNTNATSGTLNSAYTYQPQKFDPNGDNLVDPSDIFFLVNYLYLNGHAPIGAAGMMSGDANSDNLVDPADIFYAVNYLFASGPRPWVQAGGASAESFRGTMRGSISLGQPVLRNGRYVVPVLLKMADGSATPQAMSLSLRLDRTDDVVVRRAGAAASLQPLFEISRSSSDAVSYLISFDERTPLVLGNGGSAVVAEIELAPRSTAKIDLDAARTLLADAGGTRAATVSNGMLQLHGLTFDITNPRTKGMNEK